MSRPEGVPKRGDEPWPDDTDGFTLDSDHLETEPDSMFRELDDDEAETSGPVPRLVARSVDPDGVVAVKVPWAGVLQVLVPVLVVVVGMVLLAPDRKVGALVGVAAGALAGFVVVRRGVVAGFLVAVAPLLVVASWSSWVVAAVVAALVVAWAAWNR